MQTRIHVQDFHGDRVVEDENQLLRVLSQRYGDDSNLFTLSDESVAYPWLNAFVRKDLAVLYYLPTEQEMLASVGNVECEEEALKFYDNEVGEHWLSAEQVIPWASAFTCIREFCNTLSLPAAIEWRRLHLGS